MSKSQRVESCVDSAYCGVWISKCDRITASTHYYLGFSSICGMENINTPRPPLYAVKIRHDRSYCQSCLKMQKSNIQIAVVERQKRVEVAQKKAEVYGVSLQDMLMNRITSEENRSMAVDEVVELFSYEYPGLEVEDILLPLVTSRRIIIVDGVASCSGGEDTHVS